MSDPFQVKGVNHVALVCRDMARTVEFYSEVLGFPLVKNIELPAGLGQHFFFDIGNGDCLAFFWFPNAPEPAPGISAPESRPDTGDLTSAIGSMNHLAFNVDPQQIEIYRQKLVDRGIDCSIVLNHDDSEATVSRDMHPGVFVRSVYFRDPDGILLEFAAWTKTFTAADVRHSPATAGSPAPV